MSQLAEQIAVLDGIDPSIADGRIGRTPADGRQYSTPLIPGVTGRRNVLDASEGANYSGGSSYAPGLPLMPSSIGLAGIPGVLPARRHVIDPSGGVNYTGGASYAPGMPLLVSSAGLADGYGRAGLGNGYGRAGLGNDYGAAGMGNAQGSYIDQDLASAFNGFEMARSENDGRIGQVAADGRQYSTPIMAGVTGRRNVIDASEGANYSGGSSYAPGLPLMPSSIGLAGLDRVGDPAFLRKLPASARPAFKKGASQAVVARLKSRVMSSAKQARTATSEPAQARAVMATRLAAAQLVRVRRARAAILGQETINGVPVAASRPYSPSSSPVDMWK